MNSKSEIPKILCDIYSSHNNNLTPATFTLLEIFYNPMIDVFPSYVDISSYGLMHLEILESTQEARVALAFLAFFSHAFITW